MPKTQVQPLDAPCLRMSPQSMSDAELLRFAKVARMAISSSTALDELPPAETVAGLAAVRIEWKKRFPALPLSESL